MVQIIFPKLPTQEELDVRRQTASVYDVIAGLENLKIHVQKPKNPNHIGIKTSAEFREMANKMAVYEVEMIEYDKTNTECKVFNLKVDALIYAFICEESGLNKIPSQYINKVYSKAWSDAHASGYSGYYEIYQQLCELVEIFR